MYIRSLDNAFDRILAAMRFAKIVQRRMSLTNEASASPVPDELMQDTYAKAIAEVAPTNRRFALKLPSARISKHARLAG